MDTYTDISSIPVYAKFTYGLASLIILVSFKFYFENKKLTLERFLGYQGLLAGILLFNWMVFTEIKGGGNTAYFLGINDVSGSYGTPFRGIYLVPVNYGIMIALLNMYIASYVHGNRNEKK